MGTTTYNRAQVGVGVLLFDEAPMAVLAEYFDYNNIFLVENIAELPKHTGINDYIIKQEKDKQPSFGPIYSLSLVELEILKIYIEINLANGFIYFSKFLANASILFDRKSDRKLLPLCRLLGS